jgi:hypothetical protein
VESECTPAFLSPTSNGRFFTSDPTIFLGTKIMGQTVSDQRASEPDEDDEVGTPIPSSVANAQAAAVEAAQTAAMVQKAAQAAAAEAAVAQAAATEAEAKAATTGGTPPEYYLEARALRDVPVGSTCTCECSGEQIPPKPTTVSSFMAAGEDNRMLYYFIVLVALGAVGFYIYRRGK